MPLSSFLRGAIRFFSEHVESANSSPEEYISFEAPEEPAEMATAYTTVVDRNRFFCRGCGQRFSNVHDSLFIANEPTKGLCLGCSFMSRYGSESVVRERFYTKKRKRDNVDHEAAFVHYLHAYSGPNTDVCKEYYHLPLSSNYYRKTKACDGKNTDLFIYEKTVPDQQCFSTCAGCMQLVEDKRNALQSLIKRAISQQDGIFMENSVPSVSDLLEFMMQADTTCTVTGKQGVWIPIPEDSFFQLYTLTLDIDDPVNLTQGPINNSNLLVVLQCVSFIKGNRSIHDFERWFDAFKHHQGV